MIKKLSFSLLFGLLISSFTWSQDILMQNGAVTQCSGTFYDSGGEFGNYGNNENLVITICPENPGQRIQLDFTEFSTQLNLDVMTIYDGDSTAANAFGTFTGANSPGFVQATPGNTSGCLTIEFVSDGAGNTTGWAADVMCLTPCQTINAQLDSAVPAPNGDGYIRVCPNEDITLTGSGTFSVDGTGATYEWDLGDGNTAAGQTVTFSYPDPGVYIVNLNIRDTNTSEDPLGCTNNNLINQVVQVATEPDFTGTQATDSVICYGESTDITGVVQPTPFINDCTPPVADQTFLPDGSGAVYSSFVPVDCFDSSATITDASQIVSICLNMEHSFLGDLEIIIVSPNGQQAVLKDYPGGGGTYLGGANDDGSNAPGIGADYCFSMSGAVTLVNGPTINAGTPPSASIAPGTYLPEESFANLIGSPLNGDWEIIVVDNLAIDNGYIFSWEIEFDPNLQPPELSFTPAITSEAWDADPTITNTAGNVITVTPPSDGQYCYTYRVTDDFGCEYTEEVCIDVLPEIITELPNDLLVCDTGAPPYIFDLETNTVVVTASSPNPGDLEVSYHNSQADADADNAPIANLNSYSGTDGEVIYIRVEYLNSGCYEVLSFTLNVTGQPAINPVPDLVLCDDPSNDGVEDFDLEAQTAGILGAQSPTAFNVTYHLSFADADAGLGALTSPYPNTISPEPIFVRIESATDSNCYNASVNPVFNLIVEPREDASFVMNPTCDGATATISGDLGGTFAFNPVPGDGSIIDAATGLVTGGTSGATYTVEYTTSGTCSSVSSQTFSVLEVDDASFTPTPTCDGATVTINGDLGGTFAFNPIPGDGAVIDGITGEVTNATPGNTYSIEYTTSGACPASSIETFTVLNLDDPSFVLTATCDGATATISGDTGGVFSFNPDPGDGAIVDAAIGTITNALPGQTYSVEYTTAGPCIQSSIESVTVLNNDDASFTITPTCDGATIVINGTPGGVFSFEVPPSDTAIIDSVTGEVTNGSPNTSYSINYTTTGVCSATEVQTFNTLPIDDPSFSVSPTCDGGLVTITGTPGGTFSFNIPPTDGAIIDPVTGAVTNGTPGETYTIEYVTSGACPNSSSVQFSAFPLPTVVVPTPLEVCDDGVPDGITEIDLSLK
ncbi:PKD domain-containing protein, partial [uncultured Winogradskyella sp.]|uniref:PKD domain-containing protein n=1 Tax=uncultured Winogradskyella sp. TaxID=395353 RepID=UPI0035145AE7